jgi:hypothetical protein
MECFSAGPADEDPTAQISLWTRTTTLRFAQGYKENIFLSHFQQESSFYALSAVDLFFLRVPVDGPQITLFGSFEDQRYYSAPHIGGEQLGFLTGEIRYSLADGWEPFVGTQFVYQDQIFDASVDDIQLQTVRAKGEGVYVTSGVKKSFHTNYYVTIQSQGQRQYFASPLDDYWQGSAKLVAGRVYGHGSEVQMTYEWRRRWYDTRQQVESGFAIPSTHLRFDQNEIGVVLRHIWDDRRRWRSTSSLSFEENRDNGSGYFDFRRYQAGQGLRWVFDKWDVSAGIKYRYYEYSVQPASLLDPRKRRRNEVSCSWHGEYNIFKNWKIFADASWELSDSRQDYDDYAGSSTQIGVEFEF